MLIKGKYNQAKVFAEELEVQTQEQIRKLCDQEFLKEEKIRVMPDAHAGIGSTIGTTMTIGNQVVPNLVGVDIGCGMFTVPLGKRNVSFPALDLYIRQHIPSGFKNHRNSQIDYRREIESLKSLKFLGKSSKEYEKALGSLGGGNHFIEVDQDEEGNLYLIFHSGSRNMGNQVARYYQKRAEKNHLGNPDIPKDLAYLEGREKDEYLHDMVLVQNYAKVNREVMARKVLEEFLKLPDAMDQGFHTIHNYIDMQRKILRKGAISAEKGEKVLIPMNMKDGCILGEGLGNEEWNYSAPHGAGRLMSRREARRRLSMKEFSEMMESIYSTSVSKKTIDESPLAYKPMEEILKYIHPTVRIIKHLTPIYNFKAS